MPKHAHHHLRRLVLILAALLPAAVHAAGLDATCRVRSGYDFTLSDSAVTFEGTGGNAQRFQMQRGTLSAGSAVIALPPRERERIAAFESTLRALVPQVKTLAQRAVDLGAAAIREEAASASPRSAADPQLNNRLTARVAEIKARIANSVSSKDWRGASFDRYTAAIFSDIVPLVGGDLAQQALEVALRGDLAQAHALKNRATGLRTAIEARIAQRVSVLQPEVDRLCPSFVQLDNLESSIKTPMPDGGRLNLLEIAGKRA